MLKAIAALMLVFFTAETVLMLSLESLGFMGATETWIKPLIDASVMAVIAALVVYRVMPWVTQEVERRRDQAQLRSALIVFAVELMLMLLLPLLAVEFEPLTEALVDGILFALIASLGTFLWVLLPEQVRARRVGVGRTFTPFHSPWFTSGSCYLFALLLLSLMLLTLFKSEREEHRALLSERQQASLSQVQGVLSHELHSNLQDTLIFSRRPNLVAFVTEGWHWAKQLIQQDFNNIAETRRSYLSIRYIDRQAQTIIEASVDTSDEDIGLVVGEPVDEHQLLKASRQLQQGEVVFLSRYPDSQPRPIEMLTPVFDQHGSHSGLLVVTLDSDYLIERLTSSFHRPHSSLALISEGGVKWVVEVVRSDEEVDQDYGLFWAMRDDASRNTAYLPPGLASYDSLQRTPAFLGGIDGFSLKGGWPDWRLYSLLPSYRVVQHERQMIWLYLMILGLIAVVAGLGTVAYTRNYIRQLQVERQLYQLAHHDPLTGIDNRLLFKQKLDLELKHAQRSRRMLGLLYMDLDRFKPINDEYGHDVGDAALIAVVARLRPLLRASDSFARLGGDEFAVILPEVSSQQELELIAGRLVASMNQPFELLGRCCSLGVSIGISWCHGEVSGDVLIKHADAAMYKAKADDEAGFVSNSAEAVVFFEQHCRISKASAD